jgi:ADP-heptose:LPS heptosyltransferase
MPTGLQIPYRRERWLVGAADVLTAPLRLRRRPRGGPPARILLLRLERIGDLLMVLDAMAALRAALPQATIDLAVGSWNRDLAALIPGLRQVHVLDVPWLARDGGGDSAGTLARRARAWRGQYDLVINFEPDIRSNALAWLSGAPRRFGYWTGGGGAFLTDALAYEPGEHVADNALRLVRTALERSGVSPAGSEGAVSGRLQPPPEARARAAALLASAAGPRIGVHVSGGRESKQWHLDRFAAVAAELARRHRATIVLTGSAADRPMVDAVKRALAGVPVVDAAGAFDLPTLAALLASLDVLVTGDTGPMHLAAVMGTPVVALFGPSDPRRYGPRGSRHRVLRVDLYCSPCGQVRLPPARCRGHVPNCMDGIAVARVVTAAEELLKIAETGGI